MYVNAINGLVFIGDRAQNRIVVLDATQDYKVIKLVSQFRKKKKRKKLVYDFLTPLNASAI
jgi:hypothetical protein